MNARADRIERRLEWPLFVAALLTIPTIVIEQADPGPTLGAVALALNWISYTVFLAEFVVMMVVADDRWAWIKRHPLDIAILVLTPPVVPEPLQTVRALRLLRLLRLVRGGAILRRLFCAQGVRRVAIASLLMVLAAGVVFAGVEHRQDVTAWDGVWWAISTVTTVGYGDFVPVTTAGRILSIAVMLIGIGLVAVLTGAAAEQFLRSDREDRAPLHDEIAALHRRLDDIERALTGARPPRDADEQTGRPAGSAG